MPVGEEVGEPTQRLTGLPGRNGVAVVPHRLVGPVAEAAGDLLCRDGAVESGQLVEGLTERSGVRAEALQQQRRYLAVETEPPRAGCLRQPTGGIAFAHLLDRDRLAGLLHRLAERGGNRPGSHEADDGGVVEQADEVGHDLGFGLEELVGIDDEHAAPATEE